MEYKKNFSLRNKNSSSNKIVLEKLYQLSNKSKSLNSMRVNVFKQVTLELPYTFEIIQNDINENAAIISVNVKVNLNKLMFLFVFTSLLISSILIFAFNSYLGLAQTLFFAFVFYLLSRSKTLKFTSEMVDSWFKNH